MTQGGGTINTSHFRHIAGRALDVLLPPQCPSCNAAVESPGVLCWACWQQIDFLSDPQGSACGLPFKFELDAWPGKTDGVLCGASVRDRPPFQRARAVMVYGDFSRKIVLALKHGDRTDTAPAAN